MIAHIPDAGLKPVTEGIIKAEGLNWLQLVAALMKLVMRWKGRLTLTFLFGVLRVVAFIGVGILSALVVLDLKNGEPYGHWLWALAVVAPLSGLLHWLESWIAHDMAFRLLADMRIDVFRKLDQLAPAYLVRRRTGDLMALATHDIELVEYFFAHTVAPAFVAILVPGVVLVWLGVELAVAAAGVAAVPGRGRAVPVPAARQGRPARFRGARSGRRARRLRGRFGAGPRRDRRLPAGAEPRTCARCLVAAPRAAAPAVLSRADPAGQPAGDLHRPRRPCRRDRRRDADATGRDRSRRAALAHPARDGGVPAGVGDRADRPPARRHAGRDPAHLWPDERAGAGAGRRGRGDPAAERGAVGARGRLHLRRTEPPRAQRCLVRDSGRQDGGPGRHVRRRQDHAGAAADALLGPGHRVDRAQRRRPARLQDRRPAQPHRAGRAGHLPLQRHPAPQHPDRQAGRRRGRNCRRRSAMPRSRIWWRPCRTASMRRSASAA